MNKILRTATLSLAFCVGILSCFGQTNKPAAKDNTQWAVVNVSDAFMRAEPRYTSECVSQTRMGTLVQVLERKGYWAKIKTPEPYEGWVNELALAPTRELSPAEQKETKLYGATLAPMTREQAEEYLKAPKAICTEDFPITVFVKGPNVKLLQGNIVRLDKGGFDRKSKMTGVILPDGRKGSVISGQIRPMKEWATFKVDKPDSMLVNSIIASAKQFTGCPYMWGGMSPGHFDCSGLTGFCFYMNGILLPRDASQQVKCGIEIPVDQMQKGDLVFFGDTSVGHVAICIGNRKIIHASQLVRINSLVPGEPDYYGRNILHVRRIIGHLGDGEIKAIPIKDSPMYFCVARN